MSFDFPTYPTPEKENPLDPPRGRILDWHAPATDYEPDFLNEVDDIMERYSDK